MVKSAKKRKEKAADFSKAKLKLGKGKQPASNVVDTSFKARSIVLPTQSISLEKERDAPTTKRKQTFDDLISHLKHFNAGVRRDAVFGLRELLEIHPPLIEASLTLLINSCIKLIVDEDSSVRKALLSFFAWLIPRVEIDNLTPHTDMLILFTASAQTHIFPEIRIDAIRFLDLWLEYMPQAIVDGWPFVGTGHGTRVMDGFLGILNVGTRSSDARGPTHTTATTSVTLSSTSKLVVLRSLSKFLGNALSSSSHNMSSDFAGNSDASYRTWYLAPSFATPQAHKNFDHLLAPVLTSSATQAPRTWVEDSDVDSEDEDFVGRFELSNPDLASQHTIQQLLDPNSSLERKVESESILDSAMPTIVNLARTLHSILIPTFLDCSPVVFAPGRDPPDVELQLTVVVAEVARSLYTAISQGLLLDPSSFENLETTLGYMAPYFPFKPQNAVGRGDIKSEKAFQELNHIFCHLTSLLSLATPAHPPRAVRKGFSRGGHDPKAAIDKQTEAVSDFVVRSLRGEAVTSPLGRSLTPQAYEALLPTVWSLLNTRSLNVSSQVLLAIITHAIKVSSHSVVKPRTIDFMARIVLLDTEIQYHGRFKLGKSGEEIQKIEEWIGHLPRTLWELGAGNLPETEVILRFLLRLFQRKSSFVHRELIQNLQSRLLPYFSVTHPTRGQLTGPYSKLPLLGLRKLALDTVTALVSLNRHDELELAVQKAVVGTEEQTYWAHLMESSLIRR